MSNDPYKQKLPDPLNLIGRIRARLNPKCAVRQSPFCDYIISMRMQGVPFREIEEWLISKGKRFRISAPTLCKNFKNTKIKVNLTYAEEMLENAGGVIKLDLVREMSQNIITQKQRVDRLVRREAEIQQGIGGHFQEARPAYSDKRIRGEMEMMNGMIAKLDSMLKALPEEEARAAEERAKKMENQKISMSEDAESVLTDMILGGELALGPLDMLGDGDDVVKH